MPKTNNHEEAADEAFDARDAMGLKDHLDALEEGPEQTEIVNNVLLNCLMLVANENANDKDQMFALGVIKHIDDHYIQLIGFTEDTELNYQLTRDNVALYEQTLIEMQRRPAALVIKNLYKSLPDTSANHLLEIHLD